MSNFTQAQRDDILSGALAHRLASIDTLVEFTVEYLIEGGYRTDTVLACYYNEAQDMMCCEDEMGSLFVTRSKENRRRMENAAYAALDAMASRGIAGSDKVAENRAAELLLAANGDAPGIEWGSKAQKQADRRLTICIREAIKTWKSIKLENGDFGG